MLRTTLQDIYSTYPYEEQNYWASGRQEWREIKAAFGVTRPDRKEFALLEVLEKKGIRIALLCFRGIKGFAKEKQEYPLWCVRQVKHYIDNQKCLELLDLAEGITWPYDPTESLSQSMGRNVFSYQKPFGNFYSQLEKHRYFDHHWYAAQGKWWEIAGVEKRVLELLGPCIREALGEYLSSEEKLLVETRYKLRHNVAKSFAFESKTRYRERYADREIVRRNDRSGMMEGLKRHIGFLEELAVGAKRNTLHDSSCESINVGLQSEYWRLRLGLCISVLYSTMPMSHYSYTSFAHVVALTQELARFDPILVGTQIRKLSEIFSLSD